MKDKQKHIIHKQVLEVICNNSKYASQLQQNFSSIYYDKLVPVMDEVFSESVADDTYLFIDTLELDLGNIPANGFETEIIARLKESLRNSIQKQTSIRETGYAKITDTSDFRTNISKQKDFIITKLSRREALKKAFFEFLVRGTLPLWYTEGTIKKFENELISGNILNETDVDKLIELAKKHHYLTRRLLLQFSPAFMEYIFSLKKILSTVYEESGLGMLYKYVEDEKDYVTPKLEKRWILVFQEKIWILLFESFQLLTPSKIREFITGYLHSLPVNARISFGRIITLFKQRVKKEKKRYTLLFEATYDLYESISPENILSISENKEITQQQSAPDNSERKEKEPDIFTQQEPGILDDLETHTIGLNHYAKSFFSTQPQEDKGEYFFIRNSGLVLLSPYIQMFFSELKLTEQGRFIDDYMVTKGVFLLHYLSFKTNVSEENDLIFNKILCGIPVEYPVPFEVEITESEKEEAENLLKAIIRNWTVLKNTSADGLREGFLQRDGKLSYIEQGWKLKVEQKPMDVLLNSIPWSYSVIKLPWMKDFILVEWN